MTSNYIDFIKEKESKREDKGNIYCTGITDREFVNFIIDYLLGEDWYTADPLSHDQVNQVALEEKAKIYEIKTSEKIDGELGFWWCGRFAMHKWGMD